MSEGSEDTGQVSVAELLARNGQQVESRGGRRRRGVAGGGISVAELTGEIPVVRPPEDSRHTIPEVPEVSVTPPAPAPAPVTPPAPAPAPAPAVTPSPPAQPRSRRADRTPVPSVVARYTVPERERRTIPPVPEPPKAEEPRVEAPKFEEPRVEAPKFEEPRVEAPKFEAPKYERVAPPSGSVTPTPAPAPPAPPAPVMPSQYRVTAAPDVTPAATAAALPPQYRSGALTQVDAQPAQAEKPKTSMRAPIAEQPKTAAMPVAEAPPAPRPGFVPYTPIREPAMLSGSSLEGDLMRQARAAGTARRETLEEARALVHVTGEIPRIVVPKTSTFKEQALRESAPEVPVRDGAARKDSVPGSAEPEDLADREPDEAVEDAPSDRDDKHAAREWAVLIGQGIVALLVGGLLFKGFEKLWDVLPWVALVLAVLVIAGLVAVVRILRQTDDMVSLLIAIIVGVFVTIGPLAFLLTT
ncbi:hypothetical protein [Rhodococcus sp. PvR099]|uniref:hypothetical protein n=1 Tax=Rhodococcus sp. PvR099 TaxID=2806602 RepID=UPI001AE88F07|nr:hypothetical protein [Rhodococcus sp. PvR099]MBP1162480.1 hypothetical protein [Rhodococcus sp. PvR099]